MRSLAKHIVVALCWPSAMLARACAGWLWRCFCLAWARAHLGTAAVPADNQILGLIDFDGTSRIRLGRNCRVYKRVRLETRDDGRITIGDNVVLSPGVVIVAHQDVTIEPYVMLGEYASIRDQDHDFQTPQPIRESGFTTAAVTIGRDAWIGRGCCILKGVTIGAGAVIGANSVVTKDVPPRQICAGVPAKSIGQRQQIPPS
jgi:acetyltransferase-like isoleucine patch superfamily enzyme